MQSTQSHPVFGGTSAARTNGFILAERAGSGGRKQRMSRAGTSPKSIRTPTIRTVTIIGIVCAVIAWISLIIALLTDHWHDVTVDRDGLMKIAEFKPEVLRSLADNVLYFDRHRGLFYQCTAVVLPEVAPSYDEICVRDVAFDGTRLGLPSVASPGDQTTDLQTRNALVMTTVVLLSVAGLCLLAGVIVGILTAVKGQNTLRTVAMSLVFLATAFAGSSMAMFHGVDFLERTRLRIEPFPAATGQSASHRELMLYTSIRYGYSYALGWLAMVFSCLAAVLFLQARKMAPEAGYHVYSASASSASTSTFSGTAKDKTRKPNHGRLPSPQSNAYDLMKSSASNSANVSDVSSSLTPSSGDWNPYQELPHDFE